MPPRHARVAYVWLALLTVAVGVIEWRRGAPSHFERLQVERLDVVEPDGKPRLILASAQQFPGIIWNGREYPHPDREKGGLLFFNDDGTEAGGMIYTNSGAIITMDQHDQDQTLALLYDDDGKRRSAGFFVQDQPAKSMLPVITATDDAQREKLAEQIGAPAMRIFAGKQKDGSAGVWLFDSKSRPRLRLAVDAAGESVLEFLDADGKTVARLPPKVTSQGT